MQRNLTCTKCPKYCSIEVTWFGDEVTSVRGHLCPVGVEWASSQVVDTKKTVTTSVKVTGAPYPLLPVRTSRPVEKAMAMAVIKAASLLELKAPIRAGQVVARDIAGTKTDLLAVKEAPEI